MVTSERCINSYANKSLFGLLIKKTNGKEDLNSIFFKFFVVSETEKHTGENLVAITVDSAPHFIKSSRTFLPAERLCHLSNEVGNRVAHGENSRTGASS
ncbi:hypothetical protein TNIN_321421 [Trichonephila inaurata madagascariensis]|uniref:Uncharacterized protein n=1 Tax=Trichonephila inaurata madagascariensis TaxID=2747483 RepID=A0A8X6XWU4_9ARAC|nr:hypothetical protein TNIN_321421 [Trichonephila inaurata madagascariensis]